jgi:ribosomal subunit interface protein
MKKIHITAQDFSLSESIRQYIESHFQKHAFSQHGILGVGITLSIERHHVKGEKFHVHVRVQVPGNDLYAEARATDMHQAIDEVIRKSLSQLRKRKTIQAQRRRGHGEFVP